MAVTVAMASALADVVASAPRASTSARELCGGARCGSGYVVRGRATGGYGPRRVTVAAAKNDNGDTKGFLGFKVGKNGMGFEGAGIFGSQRLGVRGAPVRRSLCITAALKRWEQKEVKDNSLPVTQTLHVKVGDTVQVISGTDKKKVGEVVRVFTHNSKILVKNINFKTKHIKGRSKEESGQIIQVEAPIHSSNVMLYSKEKKVASRVGHKVLEDGRKVRYLIKTGETIDNKDDWKKVYKKEKKDK